MPRSDFAGGLALATVPPMDVRRVRPFAGKNLLDTLHFEPVELRALVDLALALKDGEVSIPLERRLLAMLFFNPSVRTRMSCEAAMTRFGGSASTLHPGSDTWVFEERDGVVMDGATQEHVRELAPVLSRFADVIGIRKSALATTAARTGGDIGPLADTFFERFVEHATRPVLNLESNQAHPLQGLADMATLVERLKEPRGVKYVLTWAWHPKSLPVATPHSQLVAACDLGMDVTLLRPEGFDLEPEVLRSARERARAGGGELRVTDDIDAAHDGARVVCAKAWSGVAWRGRYDDEARAKVPLRERWIVDEARLARGADPFFMHCLPIRRNVVATDAVLDSAASAVVDEAENRVWTAAAAIAAVLGAV